jgi:hypothetical protein
MPNTNDYQPWAAQVGANVLAPAVYAALPELPAGFVAGITPSVKINTILRQASVIAAMIAQFTADYGPANVVDDGNIAEVEGNFGSAIAAYLATKPPSNQEIVLQAKGVNLNATGDTIVAVALPAGFTRYTIVGINVSHASVSLTTAHVGLFTAASQGGTAIAAEQALSGITATAAATAANGIALALALSNIWLSGASLFLNVGTAQGAAATADFAIRILPLS